MFPIGDDNSENRLAPLVTILLLLTNIVFFFLEMRGGSAFIERWAFVPSRFIADPAGNFLTLFTSMFMHAGWVHLGSNMLYLWIFGDNVESCFGHFPFLVFYLLSGIAGTFAHAIFAFGSNVPIVGASGAIAGVLGAYLLLFPTRKVRVLFFIFIIRLPALIVIGSWFILQLMSGLATITSAPQTGGIAYLAHVGGFGAGFLMTFFFRKRR